jgi:peptidoglycan/xylan/chitin deacetylase (PgdA/CDA1 family)
MNLSINISVIAGFLLNCLALPAQNTITLQKQVPVLCYHNIKTSTERHKLDYTITTAQFQLHMQMLADSGFHTILPGQLYNYLTTGAPLPDKPVIISFDDTREEHFTIAAPLLARYDFKGVFFVMTVPIGKPGYMTQMQIKQLADKGHEVGLHTWNHPDMRKLPAAEWDVQISQPKQKLEQITGKAVLYFAYPYGAWNNTSITALKQRGIKVAFQLSNKQSEKEPLYTVRRLMVPGNWTAASLYKQMQTAFIQQSSIQ